MKSSHFDIRYHRQFIATNVLPHTDGVHIYRGIAFLGFKGHVLRYRYLAGQLLKHLRS